MNQSLGTTPKPVCTVKGAHCESCGSTDAENLMTGDQGYTACCNEPVTDTFYCPGLHE